MLVLTRRIGEAIMIDDDTTIVILGISGKQIRLGIEAPDEKVILREEIYLRNKAKNDSPPDLEGA